MRTTLFSAEDGKKYIGRNILSLENDNCDLLPDRMRVTSTSDILTFSIDGRPVVRFRKVPYLELGAADNDFPDFVYNTQISPDLFVDIRMNDDNNREIDLTRDWEVIHQITLEQSASGLHCVDVVRYSDLLTGDLAALHNYLEQLLISDPEVIGEVTLIDGMKHESGSKDPRIMTLIADLDARIEQEMIADVEVRMARQEAENASRYQERMLLEEAQTEEALLIETAIDDFFQP